MSSSTETGASDGPIACKQKPKTRAKLKASGFKQDKPEFMKKFMAKLEQTEAFGKGCKWCNSNCLKIARSFIDSLHYRIGGNALQPWGMKRLNRN